MILEIESLAATAIGFIIGGIKSSKGAKQASDEISVAIWDWIRPKILKINKGLIEEIENEPDNKGLQIEFQNIIKNFAENNPDFTKSLEEWLKKIQQGSQLHAENLNAGNIDMTIKQMNSGIKFKNINADNHIKIVVDQH